MTTRKTILYTATQAVMFDRNETHGKPEQTFGLIASLWSALLDKDISPAQVALMLSALKIARAWGNPAHEDNWVDLAGYAACGGELAAEQKRGSKMTWTIYNNDKAWGFLSADERQAFSDYDGVMTSHHYPSGVWYKTSHETPIIDYVYRAAHEPTPAVDADQTAQLDIANARITELEAEIVKSRSDVERVKADIFAETYERENPSEAKNSLNEAFLEWWNVTFDWSFFQGKGLFENHAERAFKAGWEAAKPPTTQSTEYTRTDIANARIAELEAEIVTARADALRDVQRIKADRDQGMLDYCALMERYDAAIKNQTTEEAP